MEEAVEVFTRPMCFKVKCYCIFETPYKHFVRRDTILNDETSLSAATAYTKGRTKIRLLFVRTTVVGRGNVIGGNAD